MSDEPDPEERHPVFTCLACGIKSCSRIKREPRLAFICAFCMEYKTWCETCERPYMSRDPPVPEVPRRCVNCLRLRHFEGNGKKKGEGAVTKRRFKVSDSTSLRKKVLFRTATSMNSRWGKDFLSRHSGVTTEEQLEAVEEELAEIWGRKKAEPDSDIFDTSALDEDDYDREVVFRLPPARIVSGDV